MLWAKDLATQDEAFQIAGLGGVQLALLDRRRAQADGHVGELGVLGTEDRHVGRAGPLEQAAGRIVVLLVELEVGEAHQLCGDGGSIAMNTRPASSPTSNTDTTLGWARRASA